MHRDAPVNSTTPKFIPDVINCTKFCKKNLLQGFRTSRPPKIWFPTYKYYFLCSRKTKTVDGGRETADCRRWSGGGMDHLPFLCVVRRVSLPAATGLFLSDLQSIAQLHAVINLWRRLHHTVPGHSVRNKSERSGGVRPPKI